MARLAGNPAKSGRRLDLCVLPAGTSEAGYVAITLSNALATATSCRRFVLVLSGAADLLGPGLGPYALSKRALRAYVEIAGL